MKTSLALAMVGLVLLVAGSLRAQTYMDAQYFYDGQPYGYWITKVEIKRGGSSLLLNNSGYTASPYNTYYSGLTPASLAVGVSHDIIVNFSAGSYYMGCAVWIDYNNDGTFNGTGELVCSSPVNVTQPGPTAMSFTPPAGASGVRRMRIRASYCMGPTAVGPQYGRPDDPVNTFGYGEAEDYNVELGFGISTLSPLPAGAQGIAYSTDILAVNGTTPYTWQGAASYIISGSLPAGLTATPVGNDLRISGTPAAPGTSTFTVSVNDSSGTPLNDTKQFDLTIFPAPYALPFSDDFSTAQGWQLTGPWSRGPATAFTQATPPRSEPGTDHTASTTDNMILGDTIGGLYAMNDATLHTATSPMVNCAGATVVRLRFWRWLGLASGSSARVEVSSNGITWQAVWTSTPLTPYGASTTPAWSSEFYDISAQAAGSATVQARFIIGPTGAQDSTGWCIDDLVIEEPANDLEMRETGPSGISFIDDEAAANGRDFGINMVSTASAPLTVFITNNGPSPITFGSIVKVGAQPNDFIVDTSMMSNPLGIGQSTSLTISFYRTTAGVSTATIQLAHNAMYSGSTPFDINVQGEAVAVPVMSLEFGAITIADGAFHPAGAFAAGGTSVLVFTIRNLGATDLILTSSPAVLVTTTSSCSASVSTQPSTPVAAGTTTTFSIDLMPAAPGGWSFQLSIPNNDAANDPYEVVITGTGVGGGGGSSEGGEEEAACSSGTGSDMTLPVMLLVTAAVLVWRGRRSRNLGVTRVAAR